MINIRCSSISYIMTDPRTKADKEAGKLSQTAITHLIDLYTAGTFGRHNDTENKYTRKGNMVEEDSIDVVSLNTMRFYKKNDARVWNDWINGEPDMFEGKDIYNAEKILDTKSSWDLFTFNRCKLSYLINKEVNPSYFWQMQGYMWLTGAKSAHLMYCLVNTPPALIIEEQRRLRYKMGVSELDDNYLKACLEIERNMTYNDIPASERMFEIPIERDDDAISKVKGRVEACRSFLDDLLNKNPSLMIANYDNEVGATIISK